MITIPIQRNASEFYLIVVLEDENLQRLRDYDPCEIVMAKLPPVWRKLRLAAVRICFASADEIKVLASIHDKAELLKFLKVLARGFKFRPELGDSDADYQQPRNH